MSTSSITPALLSPCTVSTTRSVADPVTTTIWFDRNGSFASGLIPLAGKVVPRQTRPWPSGTGGNQGVAPAGRRPSQAGSSCQYATTPAAAAVSAAACAATCASCGPAGRSRASLIATTLTATGLIRTAVIWPISSARPRRSRNQQASQATSPAAIPIAAMAATFRP